MKLTDKINFRQPKYMLPLIVYLPVIGTAYFVFDMFDTKIEDKPAANLQTTEYLNSDLPEAQIKGGDGIGGRYESMVKSYGKIEDHSAISNIDRNNQDEKEEYESKYSDAELELLDKEAAQSASMQDKELQEANARERDREAIAELQKALAEARLNGQKGLEPDSDKSDGSPESDGKVEMKGKIEINDKAVKGLSDAEKPNEVVKKVKTSSDYFNTLTENEKEPNLIKAIIDENVKAVDGSRVRLRLLDDIEIGETVVRKGSYLYATMSGFGSQRVKGNVKSLLVDDELVKINLHFKRNVKVRIEPGFQFDKVEIRPVSYGIEYKKVDGGIEFELVNASQKVSVEFDGDRAENLFLFPDLPDMDKPDKNESNVLYYGPGQHDVGCIVMKSNQTLYLDEGAFVYGHIVGKRIENIKISGRGVLCGARETHSDEKRTQLMNFVHCRNVEISGVTLIDSPAWTIRLKNSQDLLVDNVKQISWILNSDGLDICNCRHVRVRNCFFRNYDDCITVKNQALAKMGCEDILVENCVGWTDCANVFLVGPECGTTREPRTNYIRNVTFRNCIVLETPALHDSEEGDDGWRGGCAAINARVGTYEGAGGGGRMSDILFENIRIEDLTGGRPIATEIVSDGENTGSLTGVTFRNITFKGSKFLPAQVRGVSKKFPLRNVTLDNVVFNGKYIRKADNKKYLFINPYIENLQFK